MSFNADKSVTNLNRSLGNSSFLLKVLTIWAVCTLLIVGFLGIYPQVKVLRKSAKTYKEMKEINQKLKNKIEDINKEYEKVEKNEKGIQFLDAYLPDDYGLQNYIVDLSLAAAKSGYLLTGLTVQGDSDLSADILAEATFEGDGNFGDLVKTVESLERISQVNELSFSNTSDEKKKVVLVINIYVLEEK